jgi:hypothetical protein
MTRSPTPGAHLGLFGGKREWTKINSRHRREAFLPSIDDEKINGPTMEYHPPLSIREGMRALFTLTFYTP